jgi:hypothetical protein
LAVSNFLKQAGFLERVGSLRAGRQLARFFQGIHRACVLAAAVSRDFLFHDRILDVLPRVVEVGQCELSAFVGIFGNQNEAASLAIKPRLDPDGFGFELICKPDQPSLDFDVTGQKRKPAALLDFIA